MINLIMLNINAFFKNRRFKNYIIINLLIIIIIFILVLIKSLCKYEINNILNDNENLNFIVSSYTDKKDLLKFFNDNKKYINNINFNIKVNSIKIDDKNFIIKSYSDNFNENEYSIRINSIYKDLNIELFKLNIKSVKYDESINDETIFINQKLSKFIFENDLEDSSIINFIIKDYSMIDNTYKLLNDYGINANTNVDSNDTLTLYTNINKILNLFFTFVFIIVIVIIFLMNFNFLKEDKRNIFIYKALGINKIKLILMYIITYSFTIIVIYFIIIVILLLLIFLLNYLNVSFLILFMTMFYYFILFCIFHLLVMLLSITLLIKY